MLPPYRELSQELGVSKNTVLAAYDMLVADGVLRSTAGSGVYVEEGMLRRPPSPPVIQRQSAAMLDISAAALGYDLPQGRPELRQALCEYLRKSQGLSCKAEQIVVTSGAKQTITLAAERVISVGTFSKVLYPSVRLGYLIAPPELLHGGVYAVPVERQGRRTNELILLYCGHHRTGHGCGSAQR